MNNLLTETLSELESHQKTEADVLWVGSEDCNGQKARCTWLEFAKEANRMYDSGYGSNKVNLNLIVVGSDFWLERHEYDGSEWWEYKTMPCASDYESGQIEVWCDDCINFLRGAD